MTALRLTGRPVRPIDAVLVRAVDRLVRAEGDVWAVPADGSLDVLRRELALAGVATREEAPPAPRPDLVPALGSDLAPAAGAAIEVLTLLRLPLAEATARALGRRWLRAIVPSYRTARVAACRDLLREADAHAWWERRAWLPAGAVRHRDIRRSFRPILFDRAALAAIRPAGLVRARDGALTRWAFD